MERTVDSSVNKTHQSLFIVDMHADTMLWNRDLLERSSFGHVDLPRLREGNVALQVFAVVTKTPLLGRAPDRSKLLNSYASECIADGNLNSVGWLQVAQGRPLKLWSNMRARAFAQIDRMKGFIKESEERHRQDEREPYLMLIETADDLEKLIARRNDEEPVVGVVLAVEGAHWLGGDGQDVDDGVKELFDAGVRMLAPTHRFNNALGASSEGCDQFAGLTDDGVLFLNAAEQRGMVLDLAHASDQTFDDALAARGGPVIVSHTGVRALCPKAREKKSPHCVYERNMPDKLIQDIARTGGAVGVGYWPQAVGTGMPQVAKAYAAAYKALSDETFVVEMQDLNPAYSPFDHIVLGSDFDGAVHVPFDTSRLNLLTEALLNYRDDSGNPLFEAEALKRIYGKNACRIFATRLPNGGAEAADRICVKLFKTKT